MSEEFLQERPCEGMLREALSSTISYTESVFPRYFGILDGIRLNDPQGCIYGNPLV